VADFNNGGALVIGAGNSLTALHGGTLGASTVFINGGALVGTGTVNANVVNGGLVSPGGTGSAGLLTIQGDYAQTADGVLNIEIGGYHPGSDFDQLAITGAATRFRQGRAFLLGKAAHVHSAVGGRPVG
jgi:hypothetical protein